MHGRVNVTAAVLWERTSSLKTSMSWTGIIQDNAIKNGGKGELHISEVILRKAQSNGAVHVWLFYHYWGFNTQVIIMDNPPIYLIYL